MSDRNVLFVWIPKNAGSSIQWSLGLQKLAEIDDLIGFQDKGAVTFGHMPIPALIEGGYISEQFVRDAYKFTFIRNPYDRAVSLYRYSMRIGLLKKGSSFLEALRRVKQGIRPVGLYRSVGLSQWNAQSQFMDGVDFDFIGRYERLSEDFSDLCSVLMVGPRDLVHRNHSRKNPGFYRRHYTEEARMLVEEIYSEDLIRFNYSF